MVKNFFGVVNVIGKVVSVDNVVKMIVIGVMWFIDVFIYMFLNILVFWII